MARTVIDELIVKLGLDPRDFTKGEKQVAASVLDLKKKVQDSSQSMNKSVGEALEGMGSSFAGLVKRAAVIAIVFKAVQGVTKAVLEASRATRQLGNDARAYDIAASKLRNLQNVGEMFGGTAEGVTKTVSGLQRAIFNLSFNGQMSDSLVMLERLGVQFQDAGGHARDFKDVFLDTAGAIEQARAQGTMTEGEAYQFLQAAGVDDPGLAQAALRGRAAASEAYARQQNRRQVGAVDIAAADRNEQAITSAGQAKDAGMVGAQRLASPVVTRIAGAAEHAANILSGQEGPAEAWEAWTSAIEPATVALGNFADAVRSAASSVADRVRAPKGRIFYEPYIQRAAKRHGVDPDLLAGVLNTESGFDPSAVNAKSGATGIAQLMPKYFPGAGRDPGRDIDTAAEYLRKLHDAHVAAGDADNAGAWWLATQSYNAGQSRVRRSMEPGGKPLAQETLDYPHKVMKYAEQSRTEGSAGGNTSTVAVGEVNVYTQATDANGMADGAARALSRKLSAAQTEQGMQ